MTEKVSQHSHCQMCGKAVPVSETLCSDDCKQKYQKLIKKRKLYMYLLYGSILVIFLAYMWSYTAGSG